MVGISSLGGHEGYTGPGCEGHPCLRLLDLCRPIRLAGRAEPRGAIPESAEESSRWPLGGRVPPWTRSASPYGASGACSAPRLPPAPSVTHPVPPAAGFAGTLAGLATRGSRRQSRSFADAPELNLDGEPAGDLGSLRANLDRHAQFPSVALDLGVANPERHGVAGRWVAE